MSKFFEELWESIFTPGPTPSLLIATNVTFAILQVVLFVLLVATYSIHFIILSFLCGGLWWAINWFARELKASQLREEREEEERKRKQQRRAAAIAAAATPVSTDSETEVETTTTTTAGRATGVERRGELKQRTAAAAPAPPPATAPRTAAANEPAVPASPNLGTSSAASSQRLSGSRSGVSTEDEWEKVSENEN